MAIALTRFQGLCGFRPVEEILGFLKCEFQLEALALILQALEKQGGEREILRFTFCVFVFASISGPRVPRSGGQRGGGRAAKQHGKRGSDGPGAEEVLHQDDEL